VFTCKELKIVGFDLNRKEAFQSFCEDFAFIWDAIASEEYDKLADDAIAMKYKIKSCVSNVKEIK